MMDKNAGACKKTPANIHARNLHILPGQNHYADHRSPGNAGLLVQHKVGKNHIVSQIGLHRPAQMFRDDPQYTDSMVNPEDYTADKHKSFQTLTSAFKWLGQ
jgi:hypothetical protein